MIKTLLPTVVLLLFVLSSYSQGNYVPGSIVLKSGDSIVGFVKSQDEEKLKDGCFFKRDIDSKPDFYAADSIKSFRFNNRFYESKNIGINNPKNVFLECLVDGKVDLYFLKDNDSIHYYVVNRDNKLIELLNTSELIIVDDRVCYRYFYDYIGTLNSTFADYPPIFPDVKKTRFTSDQLVKIVKKYNDEACGDEVCIVYKKNIKPVTYIGFKAGVNYSNINFNPKFEETTDFWSDLNSSHTAGSSISIFLCQKNLFGSVNMSQNLSIGYSVDSYKSDIFSIEMQTLSIPFYFSRYYPIGNFKPFINFGIDNVITINFKTYPERFKAGFIEWTTSRYQINGLVGLGLEYSLKSMNYFISCNVELGNGINGTGSIARQVISSTNSRLKIEAGCNIKIGK